MIYNFIGETISNYRKKSGMTIKDFSVHSGVSTSLISQLERGNANPSLNVLKLIAKALNVPLFSLFIHEIDTGTLISRQKERKKVYRKNENHRVYDVLTPDFMNAPIELLIMDLKPNKATTDTYFMHLDKEEIAVVMKGKVTVELEEREYELEENDVVRIPSNIKHRFINNSDELCNVLFVLTKSLK